MPSALPDQKGPAASATEVKERPLSATLTVEATTSIKATATDQCRAPTAASASITTTPERATQRRTRTRLPTRSLRWPTQIRPKAPTNWDTAITAPAAVALQPRLVIRKTRPKMESVNCGTTSSIESRWRRWRKRPPR
jgi:hypothetical protein